MRQRILLCVGLAFAAGLVPAGADDFDHGPVFSSLEENDLLVKTDRHYTQGIKLSYVGADGRVPDWLEALSEGFCPLGFEKRTDRWGLAVGQNIYTPSDITIPELQPDDRPYAGWLYLGFIWQRRGYTAEWLPTLESFELQLGIIGPESLAEQSQTWIHRLRGFDLPQGWDNQLETEPGIALRYQRSWRWSPKGEETWFDIIPHAGGSLGNVETSMRMGATARLGWNLPRDFGVQTISSLMSNEGGHPLSVKGPNWGAHVFASAEGSLVLYTAFLDGNLFHDSHSVDKKPLVAEMKGGIALTSRWLELALSYVYRTPEFQEQGLDSGYGVLSVKFLF
jgi:hypothetical protein